MHCEIDNALKETDNAIADFRKVLDLDAPPDMQQDAKNQLRELGVPVEE